MPAMSRAGLVVTRANCKRGGGCDSCAHVLVAGSAPPFLRPAVEQRIQAHAIAHEKDAASTGAELVAAE